MPPPSGDAPSLVPGFDFLQGLFKNAGVGLPQMGQWIAPTLDPAELDKRIQELKTVQFWLEQNARLLAASVQALEVQKMTLATLQTMNLPMAGLRDALTIRPRSATPSPLSAGGGATFKGWPGRADDDRNDDAEADADSPDDAAASADADVSAGTGADAHAAADGKAGSKPPADGTAADASATKSAASPPPAVDPMQWWNALTRQFTELAAQAMKDAARDSALPGAAAVPAPSPSRKATAVEAAGKKRSATAKKAAPRRAKKPPTPPAAA